MKVDADTVSSYFFLEKRIQETKNRIERNRIAFEHHNFYTCIQQKHEEVAVVAFNIEREVIDHVDTFNRQMRYIEMMEFKNHHFKRFWQSIGNQERLYFTNRYKYHEPTLNDQLDKIIMLEVAEIEEATKFRFDNQGIIAPEEALTREQKSMLELDDLKENPQEHFNKMMTFLDGI